MCCMGTRVCAKFFFRITDAEQTNELNKNDAERDGEDDDGESDDTLPSHLHEISHVPYGGLGVRLDDTGDTFYNLVNDRRSIRSFDKNRKVVRAIIEKCILAAGDLLIISS